MNIVLAHGIFGFQTIFGINYFNGVKDSLVTTYPDIRVLMTGVAPAGRIDLRGKQLGQAILNAFATEQLA